MTAGSEHDEDADTGAVSLTAESGGGVKLSKGLHRESEASDKSTRARAPERPLQLHNTLCFPAWSTEGLKLDCET